MNLTFIAQLLFLSIGLSFRAQHYEQRKDFDWPRVLIPHLCVSPVRSAFSSSPKMAFVAGSRLATVLPRSNVSTQRLLLFKKLNSQRLLISTSARRSHATPVESLASKQNAVDQHYKAQYAADLTATLPDLAKRSPPTNPGDDIYVDKYKGGPSALDKAVHLFFFTEIIRGMSAGCTQFAFERC